MPSQSRDIPGDGAAARPTHVRYLVLVLLALASSSAYLTRHCIAVANTTIGKELHLDDEQMGYVLSAFGVGYFLCQIPGGWLGNWLGTRKVLPALSVLWSLCTVWTAFSYSYLPIRVSRLFFGMAQAGLVPNSAKAIRDWFPVSQRGIATASIGAAMSVGGAVTMWLTGVLLDPESGYGMDWRNVFCLYSLVGVVWAIAFYGFFRTKPEEHPRINSTELDQIHNTQEQRQLEPSSDAGNDNDKLDRSDNFDLDRDDDVLHAEQGAGWLIVKIATNITMWGIFLQSFFRAAGYNFFVTWFTAYLQYAYGMNVEEASKLTTWPLIGVVVGSLCGGCLVDFLLRRTGSKWISRTGVSIIVIGLCGLCMLASTWTSSAERFVVVLAIAMLFSGFANPTGWAVVLDVAGRQTAVVIGATNMAGSVAGFITPAVVGKMIDHIKRTDGDWNQVIYLHVGFYAMALIAWLFINPNDVLDDRESG